MGPRAETRVLPPVIGIPACAREIDGQMRHDTPARYGDALVATAGALPVLLPPVGEALIAVLDRLDGLLLSGSASNVGPALYGAGDETPGEHDPARDSTVLPLIRAALARGLPLLGICRGHQELNVALGGTLHQKVHDVPGRMDHRGGDGAHERRYAHKHEVLLTGGLARIVGRERVWVNSVHGQAIARLADGLAVEAVAPDGTIEGVRGVHAPGFAYAVQWHPEWRAAEDPVSTALFRAFGDACRAYACRAKRAA